MYPIHDKSTAGILRNTKTRPRTGFSFDKQGRSLLLSGVGKVFAQFVSVDSSLYTFNRIQKIAY